MKLRILSALLLSFILASCGQPIFARIGGVLEQDIEFQPESFDAAWRWVDSNITWVADPSGGKKRLPEETYARRSGDCEDFALLLAYFGYSLGDDVLVVVGRYPGAGWHCVCRYRGMLIEPQTYGKIIPESTFEILKEYTYDEALYTNEIRAIKP
jgi:hypothetical protein